jgi:hypothetical protein
VLNSFYASSSHLKATTNWVAVTRSRVSATEAAGWQELQAGGITHSQAGLAPGNQQLQAEHAQGACCFADAGLYQQLLDAQVLSQPKGAAAAALDRWELGETSEMIASNRDKAIQVRHGRMALGEGCGRGGGGGQ